MPTPPPKLPWYQFSLRSLLELTFFVAVFCSVGVCAGWASLVVLPAIVLVSGLAGRVVAGIKAGFVEGAKCGTLVFAIMIVGRALAFSRAWTAELVHDSRSGDHRWRHWRFGSAASFKAIGEIQRGREWAGSLCY